MTAPDRPVVVSWRRTCIAMPSQWEGTLSDGRWFYGRFRFSRLELGMGATPSEAIRERRVIGGPPDHSEGFDGDMGNAQFQHWTTPWIDWAGAPAVVDTTGWEESLPGPRADGTP